MKKTLIFLTAVLCFSPLWADVSPKPEMGFSFIYNTESKPAIDPESSEQIQCTDNQCIESKPLSEYGIQKLYCTPSSCFSIAYEYANHQKLIIGFADGSKRESNVFKAPDILRSKFNVHVNETNLKVTPSNATPTVNDLVRIDSWISFILILILELGAAAAYLAYTKKTYHVLYSVGVANVITTAISWLLLVQWVKETAFLWMFCLIFEAAFIWLCNRKKISAYDSLFLSLATNVTSYSLGMMISFALAPWLF